MAYLDTEHTEILLSLPCLGNMNSVPELECRAMIESITARSLRSALALRAALQ